MSAVPPRILSVGLTGGIACGRTTVGGILARMGACVVDMDQVAHKLLAAGGEAVAPVLTAFGASFRDKDGGVSRRALGSVVFRDAAARSRLEGILHPMILAETERRIAAFAATRERGIAVTDAALLVETGGYRRYHRLVVVVCEPDLQLRRLIARDHLEEDEARARIAAQSPLDRKRELADYVIDTSGTLAQTEARAHEVYGMLREDLDLMPDLPVRRAR